MLTARLLVLASLFAPAALGEFGSLKQVFVSVWMCRCRHKTCLLRFLIGMIWSCIRISCVHYLSARFCQPTAVKASDFMSVLFSPSMQLLSLISSYFYSQNSQKLFSLHFSSFDFSVCFFFFFLWFFDLFLDLSLLLLAPSLALLAIEKWTEITFKESLTPRWLCGVRLGLLKVARIREEKKKKRRSFITSWIKILRLICKVFLLPRLCKRKSQRFPLAFCGLFQRQSKWSHLNSD